MNVNKTRWDIFIILLAVFNSITLPLELAVLPPFMLDNWYLDAFNHIIDVLFFFDIVISFRTSYVNQMTGDEIFNTKKIANNYMQGRFWIDAASTIPFDSVMAMVNKS